ncbi:MAG TPA: hypothetical protein VI789_02920 [Dehalococcoidia bacterium]|nr:hypothetical protein [Dehalococcoidia bacterium]
MEALLALRPGLPMRRIVAGVVSLALVIWALVAASLLSNSAGLRPGPNDYNIAAWELRNFPAKWLFAFGELFRERPSVTAENAGLKRFFQLTREIESMEREISDAGQRGLEPDVSRKQSLEARRRERDRLENRVEATVEGRLTAVLKQAGITRSLGPLGDVVWPPVDFELTRSPYTLVVSPRDRIELQSSDLLREDLSTQALEKIESDVARRDNVSTLAFPTGGIGAYPTIIDYPTSYGEAVAVVAHEWMHNYLVFRPLGFNYYDSNALRTMNETVADLVGNELAGLVVNRWPLTDPAAPSAPAPPRQRRPSSTQRLDIGAELRRLRGEVDALLAERRIDEAEALMEQRRQELAAQGVQIRKINQAYFAFTNLYAGAAGTPGATNPIGPKIDELRRRSSSLREFVWVVGGIRSVQALDRALASE